MSDIINDGMYSIDEMVNQNLTVTFFKVRTTLR